ncbi:hypothetical protein CL634_05425 [bacterium]|nr:hypothetical protein [bacterium]|tara:strand:+ start:946 stop:1155 length:210 start_codon:yes stop_codon:yes gene_type:complete
MKISAESEMKKFSELGESYRTKSEAISSILFAISGAVGTGTEGNLANHTKIWTERTLKEIEHLKKRKNN